MGGLAAPPPLDGSTDLLAVCRVVRSLPVSGPCVSPVYLRSLPILAHRPVLSLLWALTPDLTGCWCAHHSGLPQISRRP